MKLSEKLKAISQILFGRQLPPKEPLPLIKGVGGGAKTKLFEEADHLNTYRRIIPRPTSARGYQAYEELSKELMDRLPAEEIRRIMVINNPAVSRIVNDMKKFVVSGYSLEPNAHPLFDLLFDNMANKNTSFTSVLGEFVYSLATDGAMFSELIITDEGEPRAIVARPAYTAQFRYADDADGEYSELGQYDKDAPDYFRSLAGDPTISYDVLFPETGNPYGRTVIDPGIYHLNMVRGFFMSFRQAISSIIWPNLLINVDRDKLHDYPVDEQNAIIKQITNEIKKEISKIEPGGLLTYGSEVQVGGMISGMNKTNLGAVMDCVDIMDREIIRALETEPVLFGRNEGLAESHVETQMINYGYFIRDIQKIINSTLTRYFNYILRANGNSEVAQFRLHFTLVEEYRRRAQVYQEEKNALKAGSDDMLTLVNATKAAEEAGYMTPEEATAHFQEQMDLRHKEDLFKTPR